jgi:hypothetical protein
MGASASTARDSRKKMETRRFMLIHQVEKFVINVYACCPRKESMKSGARAKKERRGEERRGEERRGAGRGDRRERKREYEGRVTHISDSRAGIVAAATPTAATPPSLMSVPSPYGLLSLHE